MTARVLFVLNDGTSETIRFGSLNGARLAAALANDDRSGLYRAAFVLPRNLLFTKWDNIPTVTEEVT